MEILEAFDLTRSLRDAGELAGCSHHTVAHWVAKRDAGELPTPGEPQRPERIVDPFMAKIEEWVERSDGKVRADVAFDKLRTLGFGSDSALRKEASRWARDNTGEDNTTVIGGVRMTTELDPQSIAFTREAGGR